MSAESGELQQLRAEIEEMRASADMQEAHLFAVTNEMEAMLLDVERQRNELAAALANEASTAGQLDRIYATVDDLIVFADAEGRIRRINRSQAERNGLQTALLLGASLDVLIAADDLRELAAARSPAGINARGMLYEAVCAQGRLARKVHLNPQAGAREGIWQMRAALVLTPQNKIDGVVVLLTDITAWHEAQTQMQLAASIIESTAEAVMVTDIEGTILSVNPAFTRITGFPPEEAVGRTPRLLKSVRNDDAIYGDMWRTLHAQGHWHGEMWNRGRNGEHFLMRGTINMIPDAAGKPSRYVSIFSDCTDKWEKDQHLRHLAFHDALTGLANRVLLEDRLKHAIARAEREQEQLIVVFIDLDGFKEANDRFGHEFGDQVLVCVAHRLIGLVRACDTVARLGGDEFVILLENPHTEEGEIPQVAERVIAAIGQPVESNGQTGRVGASIGLAIYPLHGTEGDELMKNADAAMYAAKLAGKNTYRFFR